MPRRPRLTTSLVLGAALVLGITESHEAFAAPPGPDVVAVAVLAVKSDEALDQAEALTAALRTAVQLSKGWSLGEANQSLEFLALKMKCAEPIDAACETRIADVIKADRYLWAVVDFDKTRKSVVGSVNFFVRGKGTSTADVSFSASATKPDKLVTTATDAFAKVTGGAPQGGVQVSTGGIAGQLYVDERPLGAIPPAGATIQLPVGMHTITVKAPGHDDASMRVQVQPLGTVVVGLTLVARSEGPPVDGRMVGGFVSLGLGAGLAGLGTWAAIDVNAVRNDAGFQTYRDQFSQNDDVCAAAQAGTAPLVSKPGAEPPASVVSLCDRASRDEMLQAIAFPLAAVATGLGGYLLGTSSLAKANDEVPDRTSAWTVVPMVGPQRQTLTVRYTF